MPRFSLLAVLLVLVGITPAAAAQQDLSLKRVLLSTGGVGYFEYEAEVDGNAELVLDVRLDQVDDVLKSIVVFDDKGGVGGIELPGRQPLTQVFRDLPFRQQDLASPVSLLNALQGAEVTVAGIRPLHGRILRVVPEQTVLDNNRTVTRHRVSLITAEGMRQFILEEADTVSFADAELQAQVERALAAISLHRAVDRRRLHVISRGQGRRLVRVAYVVAVPLWKAAYRLTLDADPKGTEGELQGWAVIENLSGRDWRDVELTLASGNPVTFRQALYQAYYVDRPEVPVEVMGRILPRLDEGVLSSAEERKRNEIQGRLNRPAPALRKAAPTTALADRLGGGAMAEMAKQSAAPPPPGEVPTRQAAGATAVGAAEATTQVVFTFGAPISVTSGNSLTVPIVDRTVPAERLSLYQPATQASHPLASVRLTNAGESGLPPGVLTLYERAAGEAVSYVGDARMGPLPAGEQRILSFAVDGKTKIAREDKTTQRIDKGRISRGLLQLTRIERRASEYRVAAPAREARRLLIEHPILPGWRLVEPAEESVDKTEHDYRLSQDLAAGEERTIAVVVERPRAEQLRLLDLGPNQITAFIASTELSDEIRAAFRKLRDFKGALDAARRVVADLERRQRDITGDQKRIRDNLVRVPRDSALYRRYLDKLSAQEDELEKLLTQLDAARTAERGAEARLSDYVEKLEI